ncbi:MAG: AN1-type zinc finger domain-containing protein [Nitrososphaerales archaeon]
MAKCPQCQQKLSLSCPTCTVCETVFCWSCRLPEIHQCSGKKTVLHANQIRGYEPSPRIEKFTT